MKTLRLRKLFFIFFFTSFLFACGNPQEGRSPGSNSNNGSMNHEEASKKSKAEIATLRNELEEAQIKIENQGSELEADRNQAEILKNHEEASEQSIDDPYELLSEEEMDLSAWTSTGETNLEGFFSYWVEQDKKKVIYDIVCKLNDYSYENAKQQTEERSDLKANMEKRMANLSEGMSQNGWNKIETITGCTGIDNVKKDDNTLVLSYNVADRTIIVAFHGSRDGKKYFEDNIIPKILKNELIFFMRQPGVSSNDLDYENFKKTDFGAISDTDLVEMSSIGIKDAPEGVKVHKGSGKNFQSVQEALKEKLLEIMEIMEIMETINKSPSTNALPVKIIMTGHSKGAGLAMLAAATMKHFFSNQEDPELKNVEILSLVFSLLRIFDVGSKNWIEALLKPKNIIRINAQSDPAPSFLQTKLGYKSVGTLLYDSYSAIEKRIESSYSEEEKAFHHKNMENSGHLNPFNHIKNWFKTAHYSGVLEDSSYEDPEEQKHSYRTGFDLRIIPQYDDLNVLLGAGNKKQSKSILGLS